MFLTTNYSIYFIKHFGEFYNSSLQTPISPPVTSNVPLQPCPLSRLCLLADFPAHHERCARCRCFLHSIHPLPQTSHTQVHPRKTHHAPSSTPGNATATRLSSPMQPFLSAQPHRHPVHRSKRAHSTVSSHASAVVLHDCSAASVAKREQDGVSTEQPSLRKLASPATGRSTKRLGIHVAVRVFTYRSRQYWISETCHHQRVGHRGPRLETLTAHQLS